MKKITQTIASIMLVMVAFVMLPGCNKPSSEKKILSFKFYEPAIEATIMESAKTVLATVPAGTNVTALVPIITVSDNATVYPVSGVPQNFTTPNTYTVTAEDGTQAVYTVTVVIDNGGGNGSGGDGNGNVPLGAIDGKFTINSSGGKVYFSQGNLQYKASTNTWRFAENQYDCIGSSNSSISSSYSGWIDLFGWGTSGWNSGNTFYHPWDSNNSSGMGSSYGPPGQYNLTGSYANADWGVYNAISNGGNQAGLWRTLTWDEWKYVIKTRSTASGIRYAYACVNNVNGVILLPDDWSSDFYSLSSTNTECTSFDINIITLSQWNTLERHGAVFLPAAGHRYGTSTSHVGSAGYYWSASYYDSGRAYYQVFVVYGYLDNTRFNGHSVRLVCSAR